MAKTDENERPAPSPTRSLSTLDKIRYKKAENAWAEANAVGDPGTENKEEWIRLRMHGMR